MSDTTDLRQLMPIYNTPVPGVFGKELVELVQKRIEQGKINTDRVIAEVDLFERLTGLKNAKQK
jgi:hypothetical protein